MQLKVSNTKYTNINQINFDSNIASQDMKKEIINLYLYSNNSLKYLSYFLEKKYGMHIASSTLSVNARKYLSIEKMIFKNRKEAKEYYSKKK